VLKQRTRTRVANALDRTRLLGPVDRLREAWLVRRAGAGPEAVPDRLPLPPARLRLLVDGRSGDASRFLVLGEAMFASICAAVVSADVQPGDLGAVLDFGCGCGRVLRHWHGVEGPELHGSDYNPDLVGWVGEAFPSVHANVNALAPPTGYEDGKFDLVYALSVFTHLDRDLQDAWIAEFERILKPGGLLIVSVLGESMAGRLDAEERERFDRGELVVERPRMAGRNLCSAYHPHSYVTGTLLAGFEDVRPVDLGTPEMAILQTGYIARRPARRRSAAR
jgi:SAM-dependent methyltransferase